MALNKAVKNEDHRGDKPAVKGKAGLMQPMGSGHWEKKIPDTMVADTRYASEMNACEEMKGQVDGMANYVKKHKMKH